MDARDAVRAAGEELGREVAERADQLGPDQRDLREQVRLAGADLGGQRVPVAGRPALEDVGDEDVLAAEADALQERGQQLARGADERDAEPVLVIAGGLADEHQVRGRVAVAHDHLGAPLGAGRSACSRRPRRGVGLESRRAVGGVRHRLASVPGGSAVAAWGLAGDVTSALHSRTVRVRPGIPHRELEQRRRRTGHPVAAFACPSNAVRAPHARFPTPTPAAVADRRPHGGRPARRRWPPSGPRDDVSRSCRPWARSTRGISG